MEAASSFIFSPSDVLPSGLLTVEVFGREEVPALVGELLRPRRARDLLSTGEGLESALDVSPSG